MQEVKRKADIVAIVGERLKLQKAGRNFRALCPFHSEKTASFNVSPELQMFKCFGCGESGDVFSFLEKFEGMEFPEALKYVAERVGVKLTEFRPTEAYSLRERLLAILDLATEFYHFLLMEHKVGEVARQYLTKRGVWKQSRETFRLGWAPESWDSLTKYLVGKKGYRKEDVEKVGLIIKSTRSTKSTTSTANYYDRFRGRVMFPLTNQRGQVMGFAGRLLDPDVKAAKYVNTSETELYHKSELLYGLSVTKQEIKQKDRVVVVEGELDAISSWQANVKNVVAIKGSAFTEEQIQLVRRYTTNISLALDADSAGDEATKRGIAAADKLGMNLRVVNLVGGKDPDEIAREDKEKWQKMVKEAVSVYDFYLTSAIKKWDAQTGEGKRQISRMLIPILASISNGVEQAYYIGKLARKLGVTEEVVEREVQRSGQWGNKETEPKEALVPKENQTEEILDEYILGILFKGREKMFEWVEKIEAKWLNSLAVKRVMEILKDKKSQRFLKDGEWDIGSFVEGLPGELKELVQRVWLNGDIEEDREALEREFEQILVNLELKLDKGRLTILAEKISQLEKKRPLNESEKATLKQLREAFVEASRQVKSR